MRIRLNIVRMGSAAMIVPSTDMFSISFNAYCARGLAKRIAFHLQRISFTSFFGKLVLGMALFAFNFIYNVIKIQLSNEFSMDLLSE